MPGGLTEAPVEEPRLADRGPGGRGPGRDGFDSNGGGGDRGGGDFRSFPNPNVYQIGVIVALLSISAFFIALALGYGLRLHAQIPWRHIRIPRILWLSTAFLAASSVSFEGGRRALRHGEPKEYALFVKTTTLLGLGFLMSQLFAWHQLTDQGVYLNANPYGSMFYIFTGAHGLHVLGGLLSLLYLVTGARRLLFATEQVFRHERAVTAAVALYWHFMGILWAVLFFLIYRWS
jgi:cytochrome c oxidase subunit 3